MKQVIVVHRWDGNPDADWYPWLKKELEKQKIKVEVPSFPETAAPKIEKWVPLLIEKIKENKDNLYLVGHSVGCQTILRALEEGPEKTPVKGIVLVAGWLKLKTLETDEEKETARPWLETPVNFEKIKKIIKNKVAIFSDDDPFVPLENVKLFKEKIGARIIIEKNQGHFNQSEVPIVLKTLLKMLKSH